MESQGLSFHYLNGYLTDCFCVNFRHELPGPNVKTAMQGPLNVLYEVLLQLQCHGSD
jgi:hypothetical protein